MELPSSPQALQLGRLSSTETISCIHLKLVNLGAVRVSKIIDIGAQFRSLSRSIPIDANLYSLDSEPAF